ncbi:flagellar motor switch protein FliM [Candidatus Sumerlaeota bacterium]|nr:flagellar motor switch protein FliM [Candidatus Sumerlaeota bacterium]
MSEVLSQDEVDALLKGISGGEIEVETEIPQEETFGPSSFDFANQDRIIRGRLPTLEIVHDRFARLFRTSISTALHRVVDVSVLGTDLRKFGDFMRNLPLPTSLHLIRMDPLRGLSLLVLEGRLVFVFVDTFFGGSGGTHYKLEGRDFTVIEQRLIKKVVDIAIDDYQEAWQAISPLDITHVRSEINPQFVNIVPPSDVVVTISLELEFEEASGTMTFCLPYSTLEPIREKLRAGFQTETVDFDSTWMNRLRNQISEVDVDLMVHLGGSQITGRELLNLKVGDTIILDEDCSTPCEVYVEDILKFRGRIGVHRGCRAVQVESLVDPKR